ncbi:spore protease YyaC [Paenibacillus hexagrammi]|uniref:Spore protease YyaC n=1 Tax=Paenibacillus hexagrammi TaxID=2908839 RepID=A0ABY3SGR6_9BACL|nr:spore protease YyaC [Paenibacillus sp. YPD9-1]UJF32595.1 spore protease YyaC [Paenibacillus sp. YPD9-1]
MKEEIVQPADRYWKKLRGDELGDYLRAVAEVRELKPDRLVFVCIGTDRSTGDALGPLVGSALLQAGYPRVIGTLEKPCDASNLVERLAEIPQESVVIAIDACLGQKQSIGLYQVSNQPIYPGKSVGKVLPQVGDYTIAAIVNADGPKQYAVLQTTSLYHVMNMAQEVVKAVQFAVPLD